MIEIERRYKVASPADMINNLAKHGVVPTQEKHIIDQWFIPDHIRSRAEHNIWFDDEHGEAFRIRQTELPDSSFGIVLDSKQHTEANDHNTFRERTVENIPDLQAAEAYLKSKGYYNWLTIDKHRAIFNANQPNVEIVLDEIDGLAEKIGVGAALELEYQGEVPRGEALHALRELAATFGLTDDDLFEKSLTVAAMDVLARFRD